MYNEILTEYDGQYKMAHINNEPTHKRMCAGVVHDWKPGAHMKHVAKTIKYYSECASRSLMCKCMAVTIHDII